MSCARLAGVEAHLRVLADSVKQPDVSLVARYSELAGLGGRSGREVVLRGVLLELAIHQLVAIDSRVNTEETIVRYRQFSCCMVREPRSSQ